MERMEHMEQLSKRLDGRNHAGHDIRHVQHAPNPKVVMLFF